MTPELIDHFRNPRHVGELPPPAITVNVENPICGDRMRLSARAENGRIHDVAYKVRGCTASIAAGSALTELLLNQPLATLKTLTKDQIDQALGGLANESKHAASLCIDAVRALSIQLGM